MPISAPASNRFFPNLKDQVTYHAETEFRQLRSMAYDLLDSKPQTLDFLLTANRRIDATLVAGRLLIVIARQDTVGGWNVEWAPNAVDGSLKFKGTTLVTLTTTANTYTSYLFMATSDTEAMLIAHETGGDLI